MVSAPRRDVTALRLGAQLISSNSSSSSSSSSVHTPGDVVRWMLAMQAQDFGGARWSIGLRLPGSTDATIEAALETGQIVRSWPMRGTLHFTAPEDLGWMLNISGPRQSTWAAKRRGDLEITAEQLARAGDIAVALMSGGTAIRRDRLLEAWESRGIPTTKQRGYHLIWNLAHSKLIVFGAAEAKQPTFRLFDEWVTAHRDLSGEAALAEFATRYFRSHGPATIRDFAWWASITLGDARTGVAAADGLEEREIAGITYFLAEGLEPAPSAVYALPGFDEYMLGYQDRSPALAADYNNRIVPGNNGVFLPTVVVDGDVVGTWKRTETAKSLRIDLSEFTGMTKKAHAGFERAVKRYGAFVGKPASIAG